VDWNNDGKKDLVVGDSFGYVHIFTNFATDVAPDFIASKVQVDGRDFKCLEQAMPAVVDWNNDGRKDLLCGEQSGKIWLMLNEGTDAAPVFNSQDFLWDGAEILDVGELSGREADERSSPVVFDWNGDGKKDLICGRQDGSIVFYENKGTDAAPEFSGHEIIAAAGTGIALGAYARPVISDWNNDGTPDLLSGTGPGGNVVLFLAQPRSAAGNAWNMLR